MRSEQTPVNLLDFDQAGLAGFFEGLGERSFRATQLLKWIHQLGVVDYDKMTNLSKSLQAVLHASTEIRVPEVSLCNSSSDGTLKWLLKVDALNCVESVFIPEPDRGTLCISSQVGCGLDCQFCSTARQGFNRNLTAGEIVGQLWLAARELGQTRSGPRIVTNVVLMGMGEPLLNLDNVAAALRIMVNDNAYGLSRKRVTVSTAGVVPGIIRLSRECPVSLAVSLHAPNDELRDTLVPINRKYPIAALLGACWRYVEQTPTDQVTFEYIMLDGVNDSGRHARQLANLLRGRPAKVNLIPYNPIPRSTLRRSPQLAINHFRETLLEAGLVTVTRKTRGEDINAACGQLVGRVNARGRRHQEAALLETRIK